MKKLRKWLNEQHIEWFDDSDRPGVVRKKYEICRTKFEINGYGFSVIHGFGTYGGKRVYKDVYKDRGLLECSISENEPVGYLTAEDVIKLIKEKQK